MALRPHEREMYNSMYVFFFFLKKYTREPLSSFHKSPASLKLVYTDPFVCLFTTITASHISLPQRISLWVIIAVYDPQGFSFTFPRREKREVKREVKGQRSILSLSEKG